MIFLAITATSIAVGIVCFFLDYRRLMQASICALNTELTIQRAANLAQYRELIGLPEVIVGDWVISISTDLTSINWN